MAVTRDDLKEQYEKMHKQGRFRGGQVWAHRKDIARHLEDGWTIMDYGCATGKAYKDNKLHEKWKVEFPYLYDPYVKEYNKRPNKTFNAVICCDVLEHIPEDDVHDVLVDLMTFAEDMVYATISTKEANKALPDGRNAHLTVKPHEWWMKKVAEAGLYVSKQLGRKPEFVGAFV